MLKNTKLKDHDDISVLREILNGSNNKEQKGQTQNKYNTKLQSNLVDDYRNYLSGDSDSDQEDIDLQTLAHLKQHNNNLKTQLKYESENNLNDDDDNDSTSFNPISS